MPLRHCARKGSTTLSTSTAACATGRKTACPCRRKPDYLVFRARTEDPMATVTMYCTGMCPYCVRAEMLLKKRGVAEIDKIRIDLDPQQRDTMMARTSRRRSEEHTSELQSLMRN